MITEPSESAIRAAKGIAVKVAHLDSTAEHQFVRYSALYIDRETHAKELADALEDAKALSVAYVAYYTNSDAYGCGTEHPKHTAILARIDAALAKFKGDK